MNINPRFKDARLVPLRPNTKIPAVKWGNNDTLPFTGKETGYSIDTERSGLVVIDCDVKGDKNGVATFMEAHQEATGELPSTYSVETPNGGLHFYYKATTKQARSSVSSLYPGVDVRAKGGLIVGPGSQVKDDQGNIKTYTPIDDDVEIMDLPQWLIDKIIPQEKPRPKATAQETRRERSDTEGNSHEQIEQKNTYNWALDKMGGAEDGQRNSVLNHVSYFMGCKRVPEHEARDIINTAVNRGLSQEEAETTFKAAYAKGLTQEVPSFEALTKQYNTKTSTSFKDDPMDTEYYGHIALSYNFWKATRHRLLFWNGDSSWYQYDKDKGCWEHCTLEEMRSLISSYLQEMVKKIREDKATKLSAAVYRAQERLWARSTIDSVEVMARGDFMKRESNLFDADPHLLNCKNGVMDMETLELHPHSPTYYMRKYVPVNANMTAKDQYADKIIESIHPEERDFAQVMIGQALVGSQTRTQVAMFFQGHGANGKSTFINLMLRTNGNYGKMQPPSVFLQDSTKENYAMADFDGLRMAVVEELPDSKQLNTTSLKRLVGTDMITARPIYGSYRTFPNVATVFISCNRLPMINESGDGAWRRLIVFTFPYSYKKSKDKIRNPEIDRLGDPMTLYAATKKASTAEAFLAWRIQGAYRWLNELNIEANVPASVEATVNEWNENCDLFLSWFNESLEPAPNHFITMQDALDSFNEFATRRGNAKVSQRYFVSTFKGHSVYRNNKVEYHMQKRLGKLGLTHSSFVPQEGKPRDASDRETCFIGVKFQA